MLDRQLAVVIAAVERLRERQYPFKSSDATVTLVRAGIDSPADLPIADHFFNTAGRSRTQVRDTQGNVQFAQAFWTAARMMPLSYLRDSEFRKASITLCLNTVEGGGSRLFQHEPCL